MKLGQVLRKERQKRDLSPGEVAERLGLGVEEYAALEDGATPAETWGPYLAEIAIELATPTARLVAESGRARDARPGEIGARIRAAREGRGRTPVDLAKALGLAEDDYQAIEAGTTPVETWAPILLRFAETVEQPVFNLFYPCGLSFRELEDYP